MGNEANSPFSGSAVGGYNAGPPRQVPGYHDLHRMISQLLAERVPADGRLLVVGAGGGGEIKTLADHHCGWKFDGVDPSRDMLSLAADTVREHEKRVNLIEGYVVDAPEGPYDAATSILVFHFISRDSRTDMLEQIRKRLRPGAPFVAVHLSFPQEEPERSMWIARHVEYGTCCAADGFQMENPRRAIRETLSIMSPEEDTAMISDAGFRGVTQFYGGLSLRGWIGYSE